MQNTCFLSSELIVEDEKLFTVPVCFEHFNKSIGTDYEDLVENNKPMPFSFATTALGNGEFAHINKPFCIMQNHFLNKINNHLLNSENPAKGYLVIENNRAKNLEDIKNYARTFISLKNDQDAFLSIQELLASIAKGCLFLIERCERPESKDEIFVTSFYLAHIKQSSFNENHLDNFEKMEQIRKATRDTVFSSLLLENPNVKNIHFKIKSEKFFNENGLPWSYHFFSYYQINDCFDVLNYVYENEDISSPNLSRHLNSISDDLTNYFQISVLMKSYGREFYRESSLSGN